jgi:hypothetical protein
MIDPKARPLLERWIYVLVKVGTEFLVPYTRENRERIEREGDYGERYPEFQARFLAAIAESQWPPGTYYPGGWFRSLEAAGQDPLRVDTSPAAVSKFYQEEFRVEADGTWHVGKKRIRGPIQHFFLSHLEFDADLQRYLVRYWLESYYETRYLHHESPPLRVVRVDAGSEGVTVELNDGTTEPILPESLRLDGQERLFCGVKAQGLPALFEDNARFDLLHMVEERGDTWVLTLGAAEVPLRLNGPVTFPGGTFASGV